MKKIAIIGAGGFTGIELLRLIQHHPEVEVVMATASLHAGKSLGAVVPQLQTQKYQKLIFQDHPRSVEELKGVDCVFLATPDEVALEWVARLYAAQIPVIDISGAYRLSSVNYEILNKQAHEYPALLGEAVYGLSEVYRDKIRQAKILANPGCYVTSVLLPLWALRHYQQHFQDLLIIDSKSGSSGAGGRKEKDSLGYSTVYENFKAYKLENHQHVPEMRQYAEDLWAHPVRIRFTPHLLPMFRGILTSIYIPLRDSFQQADFQQLQQSCRALADSETFLRFYENPNNLELKNIQQTNFTDFALYFDKENRILQIVSALDNLTKGAAGQALQNFNIMNRLPEELGL